MNYKVIYMCSNKTYKKNSELSFLFKVDISINSYNKTSLQLGNHDNCQ